MEKGELNQAQAVNVLIQAARIAQSKGAFTLDDAEMVSKAIRVFVPAEDPAVNEEAETATASAEDPAEPVLQKVEAEAGN